MGKPGKVDDNAFAKATPFTERPEVIEKADYGPQLSILFVILVIAFVAITATSVTGLAPVEPKP